MKEVIHQSDRPRHQRYDLVVIGSGPAGFYGAIQASKMGKKVCIIEKHPKLLGGAWVHWGTLPSKTMRETLAAIQNISFHAGQRWINRILSDLSTTKLHERALTVSRAEESLMHQHLANNNIEVFHGMGHIENSHSVRVVREENDSLVIETDRMLIATGSRPRRPAEIPFDGWRVVDSDEMIHLEQIPSEMLIFGAGVIGCEFACIFAALGVKITLVDARSRIMQTMDKEIAGELQTTMEHLGVRFILDCNFQSLVCDGPRVKVTTTKGPLETDLVFFAAGRVSNTERLGLKKTGIDLNERGAIVVNKFFQTAVPNIYAAGDVIGPPALAATSIMQGRHAVAHAFGVNVGPFPAVFPVGVYTIPELSSVGATEEELQEKKIDYVVGRATYAEVARGYIRGDHHALLKLLVCKKTLAILGVHIVGKDACNLVHIGQAFMLNSGARAQDLVNSMIFNYPTLAEAYKIAALNALNKIFKGGKFDEDDSQNQKTRKGRNTNEEAA
jgi:NAD(P) transhydrogenase